MSDIQQSIFDYLRQPFKIDKPIRLIEVFSGYGSQLMAMRRLGANVEPWVAIEIDRYAMAAYNAVHGTSFEPTDVCDVRGGGLRIMNTQDYCYVMCYSFP